MKTVSILFAALLIATPASAQESATATVAATTQESSESSLVVGLNAGPGYGTYFSIKQAAEGEAMHGAWVNLDLDLTWQTRPGRRLGLRLHSAVAPMLSEKGLEPGTKDYYRAYEISLGFLAYIGGFWISPGIGAQIMTEMDFDHGDEVHVDKGTGAAPELTLGMGYTFDVSRHVGINLAMEAGTSLVLFRVQARGGLQLRF